jgi:hypothetical protein
MKLMRTLAEAAIVGALGLTAFGLGAGVANASPPSPGVAGITLPQDKPHGDHDGDGDWGDRGDWRRGGNWGVPGGWNGGGPFGCISGPVGWGTGFICI